VQFFWYGPKSQMAPLKKNFRTHKIFFYFWLQIAPSSLKMAPPFAIFQGGGVQTVVILVKFAPLLLRLYGPRPRWPPPCYGPAVISDNFSNHLKIIYPVASTIMFTIFLFIRFNLIFF
jgi:hypothetical protein